MFQLIFLNRFLFFLYIFLPRYMSIEGRNRKFWISVFRMDPYPSLFIIRIPPKNPDTTEKPGSASLDESLNSKTVRNTQRYFSEKTIKFKLNMPGNVYCSQRELKLHQIMLCRNMIKDLLHSLTDSRYNAFLCSCKT